MTSQHVVVVVVVVDVHRDVFNQRTTQRRSYISLCRTGGGRCSESEPLSLCLVKPLVSPAREEEEERKHTYKRDERTFTVINE